MLTIMVPTYNRSKYLKEMYEKLKNQTDKNFEWVIVNDGSKDDTEKVVNEMIKENKIKINYLYQENQGKNTAHNNGVKIAKGEYFMCVDDDDYLKEDAVEIINKDIKKIKNSEDIIGTVYLFSKKGIDEIIGSELPEGKIETYYNLYKKYNVSGDKQWVFNTKKLKENLVEVQEGEKFIPEAVLFNRLSDKNYKFMCFNRIVAYKEYLEGGFSDNYCELVMKNPKGNALYYKELYKFEPTIYNLLVYDMFCIFAKQNIKEVVKNHPKSIKALLVYPLARIYIYIYIYKHKHKRRK